MDDFGQYQNRFDSLVGELNAGQYGQFRGRLIKRMSAEEFEAQLQTYEELGQKLESSMMSGDTIDDRLTTQIRAVEVNLVLSASKYLPDF